MEIIRGPASPLYGDSAFFAVVNVMTRTGPSPRFSVPGPLARSFVSVEGQYLSSRATIAGPDAPAAAALNIFVVQPIGRAWELTGGVRNVFNSRYLDPVSTQHVQDAIAQNGVTARRPALAPVDAVSPAQR